MVIHRVAEGLEVTGLEEVDDAPVQALHADLGDCVPEGDHLVGDAQPFLQSIGLPERDVAGVEGEAK
jgi:hypothetical protein